jgi:hypothetical protein
MLRRPRLTCVSLGKPRRRFALRSKAGQIVEVGWIGHGGLLWLG